MMATLVFVLPLARTNEIAGRRDVPGCGPLVVRMLRFTWGRISNKFGHPDRHIALHHHPLPTRAEFGQLLLFLIQEATYDGFPSRPRSRISRSGSNGSSLVSLWFDLRTVGSNTRPFVLPRNVGLWQRNRGLLREV